MGSHISSSDFWGGNIHSSSCSLLANVNLTHVSQKRKSGYHALRNTHSVRLWPRYLPSVSMGLGSKQRPNNGDFGVSRATARKMGTAEIRKSGVGEGKDGNACRQTPRF